MKAVLLGILSAALILVGIWSVGLGLEKTVTLVIDGQPKQVITSSLTVGGLLKSENISLGEKDRLSPDINQWIKSGSVISLEKSCQIYIQADGNHHIFNSAERLPANLLLQAGVLLYPNDRLLVDGQPGQPDQKLGLGSTHSILVRRAVPVYIIEKDKPTHVLYSAAATLGQALWEAGITLYPVDQIEPGLDTSLTTSLQAVLVHSQEVVIQTQAGEVKKRVGSVTVGEALSQAGVAPQGLDFSQPSLDSPIPADGKIRLVRVNEIVILEQKIQPFGIVYQAIPELDADKQQVLQAGENGVIAQRIRVRYEDDKEVSRHLENQWQASEAKQRVIGYGTKVKQLTLDTADGAITYWRSITMYATSYSPCRLGKPNYCHETTATGAQLKKGIVAVTRANFANYGNTQVYIPGYGFATVADIGAGLPGKEWIDLGYSDNDYVEWGQNVTVYFLWPPPSNLQLQP